MLTELFGFASLALFYGLASHDRPAKERLSARREKQNGTEVARVNRALVFNQLDLLLRCELG